MSRILVLNSGMMKYLEGLKLQNHIFDMVKTKGSELDIRGVIILLEHQPVYTIGIRNKNYSKDLRDNLLKLGADFFETNRGGLITFHGPGQLVAYPILNLKHFKPSIRWYVSQLENTIILLCKRSFDIEANISPHTGVWVKDNKLCAIGIHASRYITRHGIGLNCNTDLDWFSHIIPCGIEGKGVTSLSNELNKEITVSDVLPHFIDAFSECFNCDIGYISEDKLPMFYINSPT